MLNILIAEDEAASRNSLRACLSETSFQIGHIYIAENGKQALELFECHKPQLVITDIRMPVIDGIELANKIQDIQSDTAIIFLTAYSDLEYLKNAIRISAVDYLLKPVSQEQLEYAISRGIERLHTFAKANLPVLRDKLFRDILESGVVYTYDYCKRLHKELDIPEQDMFFCLISVRILNTSDSGLRIGIPFSQQNLTLGSTIYAVLKHCDFHHVFVASSHQIMVVCGKKKNHGSASDLDEVFLHMADSLNENIRNNCFLQIEVTAGASVEQIRLLAESAQTLRPITQDNSAAATQKNNITEKDLYVVERIKAAINENYQNPSLKVSDIADKMFYTSAYLCMVFKKATGITINDYINNYRMMKAKALLKDDGLRIIDISAKVGFSNENYFSKVFKKYEGIAPKDFRIKKGIK